MVLYQSVEHGYLAARTVEDFTAMCGGSADDGPPTRFELVAAADKLVATTVDELRDMLANANSHGSPGNRSKSLQILAGRLRSLCDESSSPMLPRYVLREEIRSVLEEASETPTLTTEFEHLAKFVRSAIADPAEPAEATYRLRPSGEIAEPRSGSVPAEALSICASAPSEPTDEPATLNSPGAAPAT